MVHLADKYGKPIGEILSDYSYEDLTFRMALFELESEEQEAAREQ